GTAARLAAERFVNDTELDALRRYHHEMNSMGPAGGIDAFAHYMDLNEAFHAAIVELAGSPLLRKMLDQVMALPFAAPSAVVFANSRIPTAPQHFAIGQEQHHVILESIENRQGSRAEATAREHARLSRRNLEMILADKSLLSQVP